MANPKVANHKNDPKEYRRSKELRQQSSPAEKILWHELRMASKTSGIRFRRQHPIHPYIVDFVCLRARLVIEVDGPSHEMRMAYDKNRDDYLKKLGYEVMRFTNEDVTTNCKGIAETAHSHASYLLTSTAQPLP